ncbi:hypothetical protein Tco_0513879 [Tanacetum coccineum]
MANTGTSLLQELARAADSDDIRDQLLVLFTREVVEDTEKMENYHRLSGDLRNGVRMRDRYIRELRTHMSDEVIESIKILKRVQLHDMEKASHLLLMAREIQSKVNRKSETNRFTLIVLSALRHSDKENRQVSPQGSGEIGQPSNPTLCYDIQYTTPSPIPVKGSNSLMEEIDFFLAPDDSIPPGIENDDYDSEGGILFLEELLSNDDDIYFDIEPDTRVFTKVVDDISDNSTRELYVHVPNVLPTLLTLSPMFDTMLPFSSENDDKVFNPGILASNEEKSPHLLSHRGFKAFQVISDFSESPMMIYEGNIPILDVLFCLVYLLDHFKILPDYEASRARGFVIRSLELQSFA